MSLSDWDVLALDEAGRPSNGTTELSPAGVTVAITENWLQVRCPEAWHPLGLHKSPAVAVVYDGNLDFRDVSIIAEGGPRRGLYWATWFQRGAELFGTVGVSLCGFNGEGHWIGVVKDDVVRLAQRLTSWAKEGRLPPGLASLGFGHALRYNQGDAYFAREMGHALSATPPGEADMPVLYAGQRAQTFAKVLN